MLDPPGCDIPRGSATDSNRTVEDRQTPSFIPACLGRSAMINALAQVALVAVMRAGSRLSTLQPEASTSF